MSSPAISVLMPCYNASEFIRESIESILSQTYSDFELIVINDGSTDDTQTIIEEYAERDKRIKIMSKSNSGLPDSLNVGLLPAKGEWIARLDADDIAMPNRLQKQIEYIGKKCDTVLLGSGCIIIDQCGNEINKYKYPEDHHELVRLMERIGSPFPHSSAFFSRKLVQKIGGYYSRFNACEDVDLWLRISNFGSIGCLSEPLIKLRKHSGSITAKKWKYYAIMNVAAIICNLRTKYGMTPPSDVDEKNWFDFLKWIENELDNKHYFDSIEKWDKIRNIWYDKNINSVERGYKLFLNVLAHPNLFIIKTIHKIVGSSLAEKLAIESKIMWPG